MAFMWLMIKERAKRDSDGSRPNSIAIHSKQLFSDLQEMLSLLNMPVNLRSSARVVQADRIGSSLLCDEIQRIQALLHYWVSNPFWKLWVASLPFYPVSVSMEGFTVVLRAAPWEVPARPNVTGCVPVCFCPCVERFFCGQWCSWVDSNPLLGSVMTDKLTQSLQEERVNSTFQCYSEVKLYAHGRETYWLDNQVVLCP